MPKVSKQNSSYPKPVEEGLSGRHERNGCPSHQLVVKHHGPGERRGSSLKPPGRCMTRHLPFGTGCAPCRQVLLLVRLPNEGGFGSHVALGEIRRVIGGRGGLVERTIQASSPQIERLRGRAPLSPEEKSARAQVLRVVLVSQRQSLAAGTPGGCFLRDRGHDHVAAPRLLEAPSHRFR